MKFSLAIALAVTFAAVSHGAAVGPVPVSKEGDSPMSSIPNKWDTQSSDITAQHWQRDIVDSRADSPFRISSLKRGAVESREPASMDGPRLGWKRAEVDRRVESLHDWKRNEVDRRVKRLHDWKRGLESEDVDALA